MTPSNRSWQSLLTALPSDPVEEARTLALRTLTLPSGVGIRSKMIDVNRLSAAERSLLDDGDLIPAWAQYWLTLAQALCELSRQRCQAAVVIIPHPIPSPHPSPRADRARGLRRPGKLCVRSSLRRHRGVGSPSRTSEQAPLPTVLRGRHHHHC